jgi:hypothetical protein
MGGRGLPGLRPGLKKNTSNKQQQNFPIFSLMHGPEFFDGPEFPHLFFDDGRMHHPT